MSTEPSPPDNDPDSVARLLRSRLRSSDLDLPVNGSSMRGTIESGSTVSITAAEEPRAGEVWAFAADDGRLIVHRIRHLGPDTVTPRGVGNPLDDRPVPRSRLIGRVTSGSGPGGDRRFGSIDRITAAITFRGRAVLRAARMPRPSGR